MIASINGPISYIGEDHLVITVGGLGLKVYIQKNLIPNTRIRQMVTFWTHLVVREDLLAIYGFETNEQKDIFVMLLGVSGIGPKSAMSIVSNISIDQIRKAVLNNQPELLSTVPGVGNKTAQKIVLFLHGKISTADTLGSVFYNSEADTEVLQALTALGYSVLEAQSALQSIPKDASMDVGERIKISLQFLSK
jgi:holliday junction DNA helicase RuvA